jgi:hypothetical protein
MATQLSPELLEILKGLGQTGGYADPASGMYYQGTFSGQGSGEDSGGYLTGYTASGGPTDVETARADTYGLDGNKTGNISAYDPKGLMQKEDWMGVLAVLGATLGGGALAAGMGGGAAGGSGAFLGEGALSGIGGWDAALAGASPGMAGGAAVGPGMAGWGADLGMAGTAGTGSGMGTTLAGTAGGGLSAVTPSAGGGLLDGIKNLVPSGVKDYLGPAATIAGGLLGAKGNEATSTSTKSLDPRMDAMVYGNGSLTSKVQDLLNRQTSQTGLLGKYWK